MKFSEQLKADRESADLTQEGAAASMTAERERRRALTTLSATKGLRAKSDTIPLNMRGNVRADSHRAWSHSDLAGVLWEHGIRASRAIAWARIEQWSQYHSLTVEPITSTAGVIRWEIQTPDKKTLATTEPANKGALHRTLNESGFRPSTTVADLWIK